jgi:hypothetical protein
MKNQTNMTKSILAVAIITVLILLVPLIAMQFTTDVDWSLTDFILMGALIFGTGVSFVFVMKYAINFVYRIAMAMAFGTTFLLVWANLAVGLIGSGANLGNLMYLAVYAIVIVGSIWARFASSNMERVMYLTAISLVVVAAIAIFANMGAYPGSSINEIVAVNGFFALLYAIGGSLFRLAGQEQASQKS